jgi:hypothetical protein
VTAVTNSAHNNKNIMSLKMHTYVSRNFFSQVAASEIIFGPTISMKELRKSMAKHREDNRSGAVYRQIFFW